MIEPILSEMLNYYMVLLVLPSPFDGQNKWDYFDFDWRQTGAPMIGEGYMDMYMHGELLYRDGGCGDLIKDTPMMFVDSKELSQLVVS
jgi:hypothetical protein